MGRESGLARGGVRGRGPARRSRHGSRDRVRRCVQEGAAAARVSHLGRAGHGAALAQVVERLLLRASSRGRGHTHAVRAQRLPGSRAWAGSATPAHCSTRRPSRHHPAIRSGFKYLRLDLLRLLHAGPQRLQHGGVGVQVVHDVLQDVAVGLGREGEWEGRGREEGRVGDSGRAWVAGVGVGTAVWRVNAG